MLHYISVVYFKYLPKLNINRLNLNLPNQLSILISDSKPSSCLYLINDKNKKIHLLSPKTNMAPLKKHEWFCKRSLLLGRDIPSFKPMDLHSRRACGQKWKVAWRRLEWKPFRFGPILRMIAPYSCALVPTFTSRRFAGPPKVGRKW